MRSMAAGNHHPECATAAAATRTRRSRFPMAGRVVCAVSASLKQGRNSHAERRIVVSVEVQESDPLCRPWMTSPLPHPWGYTDCTPESGIAHLQLKPAGCASLTRGRSQDHEVKTPHGAKFGLSPGGPMVLEAQQEHDFPPSPREVRVVPGVSRPTPSACSVLPWPCHATRPSGLTFLIPASRQASFACSIRARTSGGALHQEVAPTLRTPRRRHRVPSHPEHASLRALPLSSDRCRAGIVRDIVARGRLAARAMLQSSHATASSDKVPGGEGSDSWRLHRPLPGVQSPTVGRMSVASREVP